MEGSAGLSEKGSPGARAIMVKGPIVMGADAVEVVPAAARSSALICWLWDRSVFFIEVILY